MTLSERLAEFALGTRYAEIPVDVRDRARLHLLDAVGVCIAASTIPPCAFAYDAARPLGDKDESTAIGFFRRLPAASAALVNGTLLHGLEFDDTHARSIIHGSSVVVPASLAVAEATGGSGADLVAALVVGWEILIRLGAAGQGALQRQGFQTTAVCGPFAAAAVAGRLMGFSHDRLTGTLGIAGSQAAGIFEYLADGASVKAMHPGLAAHAGLLAVSFAAAGFRGPRTVLDGRFGFYRAYLSEGDCDLALVTSGLGEVWHTREISVKPYPCCHFSHAFIDCARSLREAGLRPEQIKRVVCRGPFEILPIVGEPWADRRHPRSGYDARFSLPYCVAAMLVHGRVGHETFEDSAVAHPAVLEIAERIEYELDPSSNYPATYPGWLQIETKLGRTIEHRQAAQRGGPENPMSPYDLRAKFFDNATRRLTVKAADGLAERLLHVEQLPRVAELWAGLG